MIGIWQLIVSCFALWVGVRFSSYKSGLFSFWLPACLYHHQNQPQPPHCQASIVAESKPESNIFLPRGMAERPRRLPTGQFHHWSLPLSADALSPALLLFSFFSSQGTIVERALFQKASILGSHEVPL